VDSITVTESVNVTAHDCAEVHIAEGFGCPADTEGLIDRTREATRSYEDGLHFIARALRTELDDVTFEAEYVATETAIDVGFMRIEPGCIVAMRYVYTGWVAGPSWNVWRGRPPAPSPTFGVVGAGWCDYCFLPRAV